FLEIGIDDVLATLLGVGLRVSLGSLRLAGLIHGLAKLHRGFGERIRLSLDILGVVALDRGFQLGQGIFDRLAVVLGHLVAVVLQRLLGRMDERFALVAGLDRLAAL